MAHATGTAPEGWQQFAWGMTVQEVQRAVADPVASFNANKVLEMLGDEHPVFGHTFVLPDTHFRLAGVDCTLRFGFVDGRLYEIALPWGIDASQQTPLREKWLWFMRVCGLLKEKYGEPIGATDAGAPPVTWLDMLWGQPTVKWRSRHTIVELSLERDPEYEDIVLYYQHEPTVERLAKLARERTRARRADELKKL